MKYRLTILLTVVITVLCTIPVPEVPELDDVPFFDKWVHFVMFGALAVTMYIDRRLARQGTTPLFILSAFLFPSFWGGLMELVQAYLTTCRSGEWLDFYADTFGALLGTIISYTTWKITERISVRN